MLDNVRVGPSIKPDRARCSTFWLVLVWMFSYSVLPNTVVFGDIVIVWVSSLGSGTAYHLTTSGSLGDVRRFSGCGLVVALSLVMLLNWREAYRPAKLPLLPMQMHETLVAWCVIFLALATVLFLLKLGNVLSRGAIVLFIVAGAVNLCIWRWAISRLCRWMRDFGAATGPRVAIFAESDRADLNERMEMLRRSGYAISRVFLLPKAGSNHQQQAIAQEVTQSLISHVRHTRLDEIILLVRWNHAEALQAALSALDVVPLPVKLLPDPETARYFSQSLCDVGRARALVLKRAPLSPMQLAAKRGMDLIVSLAALICLLPAILMVALAVALDTPGPVVFRQWRGGYNRRRFEVYKFRTMTVVEHGQEVRQVQRNDRRVTRTGRVLRRLSLDELPQLLNVLKGDMSLVGPRPHALAHDDMYARLIAPYAARHNVKPGITGWAQVNGCRGETADTGSMQRRIDLDLAYIEQWSLWLDVRIILLTVREVFFSRHAY